MAAKVQPVADLAWDLPDFYQAEAKKGNYCVLFRTRNTLMWQIHSLTGRLIILSASIGLTFGVVGVKAQQCSPPMKDKGVSSQRLVPTFLDAWIAKYPTSTLPARMEALTGRDCNVCHHPPNLNTPGNCYRADLAELINLGMTIEDALNQLDTVDSDGDGVTNGEEAVAARPEAGQFGFNQGLIGELGTDPCGTNPSSAVTGMSETPAQALVPAVSDWGMIVLGLLMAISASLLMRKRVSHG